MVVARTRRKRGRSVGVRDLPPELCSHLSFILSYSLSLLPAHSLRQVAALPLSIHYCFIRSDVFCLACSLVHCHLISCLCPSFGFLPDFHGSCSVIACVLLCPFSHCPGQIQCVLWYCTSAHSQVSSAITFPSVCPQTWSSSACDT